MTDRLTSTFTRRTRTRLRLFLPVAALVVLSACAPGPNPAAGATPDPAGFWPGLWHGIISPVTFVISLFNDNISMYEVDNNGNWYDFGFFFGLLIALGGAGSRARKRG